MPEPSPIFEVARTLGVPEERVVPYGKWMAKLRPEPAEEEAQRGRLVLVSAITPTPAGEGKTTVSIGLADGLRRLGERVCLALREPSMGPVFGVKGGGTGGGRATLVPARHINLHFTGDFHAVASAHNLLAALLDNHLHHGNEQGIDPRRVVWPRVLDVNDRSLRHVTIGLGGPRNGVPRESGFDITAASEVMAALCLAADGDDLRARLGRMLVALTRDRAPVTAADLQAPGPMMVLLADTLMPNLVQTGEGVPALVHGGPFANIAHGCNSVIATKAALRLADWVVTEAGFGFDLGAEKFYDIKCRTAGLDTAAVVCVATVRALKMHGGTSLSDLATPDAAAVERGLPNLHKHIENIRAFGEPPVIALNRFPEDSEDEIAVVRNACSGAKVPFAVTDCYATGGEGAVELARTVIEHAEATATTFTPLYELDEPLTTKLETIATRMYGAREVAYTPQARRDLRMVERLGFAKLPVCVAKTSASLSDDPKVPGRPEDFTVHARGFVPAAGAGFVVALLGDILRMPGLPRAPQAVRMDWAGSELRGLDLAGEPREPT